MWPFTSSWRQVCLDKEQQQQTRIQDVSKYLISASQIYLSATATEIVKRIAEGEWTASDVLTAYVARSILAQKHTNAVTEVLFAQAIEEAKQLDQEFSQTRKIKGPLHGVPISFKDQYDSLAQSTFPVFPSAVEGHGLGPSNKKGAVGGFPPFSQLVQGSIDFTESHPFLLQSDSDARLLVVPKQVHGKDGKCRIEQGLSDLLAVQIVGYDASLGFSAWCNKPSTRDADLVRIVREAGGIPIVKTNVPQTMLAFECSNPVFGRTKNPWSSAHTSGGSSGGEAALLACDGSALGFGSDIGGSLRIPAVFSGIYSLKPGPGRISHEGTVSPVKGFVGVDTVVGPMGRSVEDLDTACRLVFGRSTTSHAAVAPLPYRDIELPKKLKFGYYLSDGCVKASPASQRAVLETVTALQRAGHECVEFEPTHIAQCFPVFVSITAADGYSTLLSNLGPDPREKSLFLVTLGPKLPGFIRSIVNWVIRNVIGDTFFANMLAQGHKRSVTSFWQSIRQKNDYNQLFYEKVWDQYGFDGLIAPGFSTPALPHGATKTLTPLAVSTIIYNIVDSPVGVVPVTRVDPKLDALTEEWFSGPGRGSKILETGLFGTAHSSKGAAYDPVSMKGLPMGVQIVGKRWEEEKVLGMMKVVDDALGDRGFGPGTWAPK